MRVEVTTHHLEMLLPGDLRPSKGAKGVVELRHARIPCPELNRFFYREVGRDWSWIDRLPWSLEDWRRYLSRPELETWIILAEGTPAGYFELETQPGENQEIVYFGILPGFIGRGLGGQLLTGAARRAFERGARRLWVHTCSLDHPSALAHYQARGFKIFKVETEWKEIPDSPPTAIR